MTERSRMPEACREKVWERMIVRTKYKGAKIKKKSAKPLRGERAGAKHITGEWGRRVGGRPQKKPHAEGEDLEKKIPSGGGGLQPRYCFPIRVASRDRGQLEDDPDQSRRTPGGCLGGDHGSSEQAKAIGITKKYHGEKKNALTKRDTSSLQWPRREAQGTDWTPHIASTEPFPEKVGRN